MGPVDDRLNHEAIGREQREPTETPRAIPAAVALVAVGLAIWGAAYLWNNAGDGAIAGGDHRTAEALAARTSDDAAVDGEALFQARCSACHQATGKGLPGAFPPLAGSDWVLGAPERPAAIVLTGLSGPIEVAGQTWQGQMPTFRDQLSDAQIAAVLSYVRGAWGNDAAPITADLVGRVRAEIGEHDGPLAGQQELVERYP